MPTFSARAPRKPQIQELIVIVKVERIRRGRRLPDVGYIEARSRRRPRGESQEMDSLRDRGRSVQPDHSSSKLRLPWRIKDHSQ
jgi:hypothetical protein